MPKILERDPAWLADPKSAGSSLFSPANSSNASQQLSEPNQGPQRRIAHRGTEIFVAVGNELRWSDLGSLHERHTDAAPAYRLLKIPVHREIAQLSISPSGNYIAILTSHTCHISILPASTHLRTRETSPLRLKSFQLGPTAHVLEQAALVSAIWHPLSPTGNCLLTVTLDACVRLWELDGENRSSFDEPALAVDLKKLGNAISTGQEDLSASKYGANRGFSPDDVEMQVAAACFGGQARDDEHGWASMTLWVAMTEGDVYALCPLLPARWLAPASLLPSLSTSVMEQSRAMRFDRDATESEKRVVEDQSRWLGQIDAQDPVVMAGKTEFDSVEVYSRPDCLSAIPRLQGPFAISPEPDFGEITDIYVVGPKVDDEALFDEDNDEDEIEEGLSVSVICLATSTNEVHVCLDLDGVEAEWLPRKRARGFNVDDIVNEKELLLFETIDLANNEADDDGWPTFTPSPLDRYGLLVTCATGVCGLSFRPWVGQLEEELSAPTDSGAALRLDVVLESSSTLVDQPVSVPDEVEEGCSTAIALLDPIIGFLVLTVAGNTPFASILDAATAQGEHPYLPDGPTTTALLPAPEPRAAYRPSPAFDQQTSLPQLLKVAHERGLLGNDIKRAVRFSPATLQVMTEAHRLMSAETHRLGVAAADLFRRCERMRSELAEQVRQVNEIADRVDAVTAADDDETSSHPNDKIESRIKQTQDKASLLNTRVDALHRRMRLLGGRGLSAKEAAFAEEVQMLQRTLALPTRNTSTSQEQDADSSPLSRPVPSNPGALATRFEAVKALHGQLSRDASAISTTATGVPGDVNGGEENSTKTSEPRSRGASTAAAGITGGFRRQRLAQVMALLERETALIEAVAERLKRLNRGVGAI